MANVVRFGAPASIEHEARDWLVRMDGDEPLSAAEREGLREWMGRSTLHRNELRRLSQFWSQANILTELIAADFEACTAARGSRRGGRWVRKTLMGTSAVFASVALVCLSLRPTGDAGTLTYATAIGAQRTVQLSDGTSLQLNTNSQLQVAYGGAARRIRLLRGEALFSVTPDAHRVFEVYVADSIVRAIGTEFVIHVEGRQVDVMVTKGSVDVLNVADPRTGRDRAWSKDTPPTSGLGRLKAGEALRFKSGGSHLEVRQLGDLELQRRLAWQEGFLAFSGEPLRDVVAQLNRYSTTTLEIGDPKLASLEIGGRFRIGDVASVLDFLNTAFGIRARQVDAHNITLESVPGN